MEQEQRPWSRWAIMALVLCNLMLMVGMATLPGVRAQDMDTFEFFEIELEEPLAPEYGGVPTDLVGFFPGTTCPTGWSVYGGARGRYIVGATTNGTVAQTFGDALANSNVGRTAVATHSHTFAGSDSIVAHSHTASGSIAGHGHSFSSSGAIAGHSHGYSSSGSLPSHSHTQSGSIPAHTHNVTNTSHFHGIPSHFHTGRTSSIGGHSHSSPDSEVRGGSGGVESGSGFGNRVVNRTTSSSGQHSHGVTIDATGSLQTGNSGSGGIAASAGGGSLSGSTGLGGGGSLTISGTTNAGGAATVALSGTTDAGGAATLSVTTDSVGADTIDIAGTTAETGSTIIAAPGIALLPCQRS